MQPKRIILVPPADPGSKGDEAMMRGALALFADHPIVIVNQAGETGWINHLQPDAGACARLSEVAGPPQGYAARFTAGDALFVVGADVIDGTCGLEASRCRRDLIAAALLRGLPAFVTCSFRSDVADDILDDLALLHGARFLLRDRHSLHNFRKQTGLEGIEFPDLSFFMEPAGQSRAGLALRRRLLRRPDDRGPVLGINFAEHAFRSFHDRHDDTARNAFVAAVLGELLRAHPQALFVLFSNDRREWPNHPSDDHFNAIAADWISAELGPDRVVTVDAGAAYADNIAALREVDILVTGRMHLALAALRAARPAIITMGQGRRYTSIDKMRGAFDTLLGSDQAVVSRIDDLGATAVAMLADPVAVRGRLQAANRELRRQRNKAATMVRSAVDAPTGDGAPTSARLERLRARLARAGAEPATGADATGIDRRRGRTLDHDPTSPPAAHLSPAENRPHEPVAGEGENTDRAIRQAEKERDAALADAVRADEARRRGEDERDRAATKHRLAVEEWRRTAERLAAEGQKLAEALQRARANPSSLVALKAQRLGLRTLISLSGLVGERHGARWRRSLAKRTSGRPVADFGSVLMETGVAAVPMLPRAGEPEHRRARAIAAWALSGCAVLAEPFSPRLAGRLRRSAGKRRSKVPVAAPSAPLRARPPVSATQRARRVLVADYRLPRPDVSAGERATFGLIADLVALGFEVTVLPADMAPDARYGADLSTLGATVITASPLYPTAADYLLGEGDTFGTFYFIRVNVAEMLLAPARQTAPDARIVFHAPDLHFLRQARGAALVDDADAMKAAEDMKAREIAIMQAADHVVIVSPAELPHLDGLVPSAKVSVFPALYCRVVDAPAGYEDRSGIFFLAGFKHAPNGEAVTWFVERIWPAVRAALPGVAFDIVGAEAPPEIVALASNAGVNHVGQVEDLDPLLSRYRVGVAPLRHGAGIKGKLGMAMAAGVPSVTTTIGAEGMGIVDDQHALVRDDGDSFARAVVALYTDKARWERLAGNGRALAERRFGEAANRCALIAVLALADALPAALYARYCRSTPALILPAPEPALTLDVSVIVVSNGPGEDVVATLNALRVASQTGLASIEVLLVAESGRADVAAVVGAWPALRIVAPPAEGGFARSANEAVGKARGEAILFLPSGHLVLPGLIDSMLRVLGDEPSAAVVAASSISTEGDARRAGGVLFRDGSTDPAGPGPRPTANHEIDRAGHVPFLVRRRFLDTAGPFDPHYRTADGAEADLAMRARAHGGQVVLAASAVAIAPAEPAADPDDGLRFHHHWRSVLAAGHLAPGVAPDRAAAHAERQPLAAARARRRAGRLNILYFSPFPSHPANHGNQATIQSFGQRFRGLGHRVHFALLESPLYEGAALAAMRSAWDTVDLLPNGRALWSDGTDIPFDGWYEPGLGEAVHALCARHDIDVVFCSYVFQSRLLDHVPAHVLKVIDTHDKMGDRYDMLRRNGQPLEFFSCTPEEEGAYLRRADIVVARRAEEARYFDAVSGRRSAVVVPHVEEMRFIHRPRHRLRRVAMVASANRINLAIAHDLVAMIGDRFGDACPFQLDIAGEVDRMIPDLDVGQRRVFDRPWLRMHGFVADIGAFYAAADIVVAPVTMGTGINVKTVQAMAFGMPLLSTAIGIKGIETGEPLHGHATVADLVDSLVRLLAQPEELDRLADISRTRYRQFVADADAAIASIFAHPKLRGPFPEIS